MEKEKEVIGGCCNDVNVNIDCMSMSRKLLIKTSNERVLIKFVLERARKNIKFNLCSVVNGFRVLNKDKYINCNNVYNETLNESDSKIGLFKCNKVKSALGKPLKISNIEGLI